jgi:hypothetical protein
MNDTLVWLLPALGGVLGVAFFAGASWQTIANSRRATTRMFNRLEEVERLVSEHEGALAGHGLIRKTVSERRRAITIKDDE